jgi:hypothetical protein
MQCGAESLRQENELNMSRAAAIFLAAEFANRRAVRRCRSDRVGMRGRLARAALQVFNKAAQHE